MLHGTSGDGHVADWDCPDHSNGHAADAPARPLPTVVQDLLCAFDGVDGQYVRARVAALEGRPYVAFALEGGRLDATLAEHIRMLLPIWCCHPAAAAAAAARLMRVLWWFSML